MIVGSEEEWEKGRHGARPDETIEECKICGSQSFCKEGVCRECRGVCEDCGREDVSKEKLMRYGMGEMLCPDCYICRLY